MWMIATALWANGQTPAGKKEAQNAKQAVIVEEIGNTAVFEKDGTGWRELHAKFRIISDAALQQFGVLTFPYLAANEEVQITDVHVRKPDGSIIKTTADDIQDMPSEVTRVAPLYSDLHEKHVPVKGLGVGDELEYSVRWTEKLAQIPDHFVFEYRRIEDAVVERETLTVKTSKESAVTVKSPDWQPMLSEEGKYKVYTWQGSRAEALPEEKLPRAEDPPTVQITNFKTWNEIAEWYWGLQKERIAVTPAVQAKAAELTKSATSDDAKIRAIYNYVSLKVRYIGIDFGQGRYQPHSAEDVMSNQYGDCKDKHTLFAALLSGAGIKSYPVLISTERKLDDGVPSVLQFNHVITAVKQNGQWIFLDTTPQVAPYGMLVAGLRGKQALIVTEGPTAELAKTPTELPFDAFDLFRIKAKLDASGTLEGDVERDLRGDSEVLLRLAFRNTPEAKWQELVQAISYGGGFGGDVSQVSVSDPDATQEALEIRYHYHRKDFGDWENHRIPAPMPGVALPERKDLKLKAGQPLILRAEEADYSSTIEIPPGFSVVPPVPVHISNELGTFESYFTTEKGLFKSRRKVKFKVHEVGSEQDPAYEALRKAIVDDYGSMVYLMAESKDSTPPLLKRKQEDVNAREEAGKLFFQAATAGQQHDLEGARQSLQKVVKLVPDYPRAWMMLGSTYMMTGDTDQGLEDMRKEVELHPDENEARKSLAFALMSVKQNREAEQVWRALMKRAPQDRDAAANLGNLLMQEEKYQEAYALYVPAVKLNPESASLYNGLGVAAIHSGNVQAGVEALDKVVQLDPERTNEVAYELALANQSLPKALEYAKRAVADEEKKASGIRLDALEVRDLRAIDGLWQYWDTLGWVYFRLGDLANSKKFLVAAWNLSQYPEVGDHVGQLYETTHESDKAAEMYALTIAGDERMNDTRERLAKLLGSEAKVSQAVTEAHDKISRLREFKIPRKAGQKGSAEFFVLLGRGSKAEDVRFIKGDESLKPMADEIAAANLSPTFPDDAEAKIVRRGILECTSLGCDFVLLRPQDVRSAE